MTRNFEDDPAIGGPGPVGKTEKLDIIGPNGVGTRASFRVVEKATGRLILADEVTFDPKLHERLPGSAP